MEDENKYEYELRMAIHQLELDNYQKNARIAELERENKALKDSLQIIALQEKPRRRQDNITKLRWQYYHDNKARILTDKNYKVAITSWRDVKSICNKEFLLATDAQD